MRSAGMAENSRSNKGDERGKNDRNGKVVKIVEMVKTVKTVKIVDVKCRTSSSQIHLYIRESDRFQPPKEGLVLLDLF